MIHETRSAQISQKQDDQHYHENSMPCRFHCHKAIVVITGGGREAGGGHIVSMITYILCSLCFCEIWALCVVNLWITYDHLYFAPCLACWVCLGSFPSGKYWSPGRPPRTSRGRPLKILFGQLGDAPIWCPGDVWNDVQGMSMGGWLGTSPRGPREYSNLDD